MERSRAIVFLLQFNLAPQKHALWATWRRNTTRFAMCLGGPAPQNHAFDDVLGDLASQNRAFYDASGDLASQNKTARFTATVAISGPKRILYRQRGRAETVVKARI